MFKVNNKDTRTTPMPRSGISFVNFEEVNADWVCTYIYESPEKTYSC